jgi:transcription-repair coupling factor (superfamily II helicase)
MLFINKFAREKSWQKFINDYTKTLSCARDSSGQYGIISDEDIWPFIISAFFKHFKVPVMVLVSTSDRAGELGREIKSLDAGMAIYQYPGMGTNIFSKKKSVSSDNISSRLEVFKALKDYKRHGLPFIIIATGNSILDKLPAERILKEEGLTIRLKNGYKREELILALAKSGYERVNKVYDRGEFAFKGDVLEVFDITAANPVRIDFFGDTVEKIFIYDTGEQKISGNLSEVSIFPNTNILGENSFDEDLSDGSLAGPQKEQTSVEGTAIEKLSLPAFISTCIDEYALIVCDPEETKLKINSDLDIIYKSLEVPEQPRSQPALTSGRKNPAIDKNRKNREELYVKNNFISEEFLEDCDVNNVKYRLDLMSLRLEITGPNICSFDDISRQKKSFGNSENLIQNLKRDIKNKKIPVISLKNHKRLEKISGILLDNGISFENFFDKVPAAAVLPDEKCPDDGIVDFYPGMANMFDIGLLGGYQSKSISLYGELDIYEQLEYGSEQNQRIEKRAEDFEQGDYVVHKTHGIGRYLEIISEQVNGNKREYFLIEYSNKDKLYVPTWQSDRIHKYIGDSSVAVSALNSRQWENLKKKVRASVHKIAVDLAALYAVRNAAEGFAFGPDSVWQKEMEDLFPFVETADQEKAINYVKELMENLKPMDVLVCGDVGFGKTEVAVRAAFKAIENGKQVMMLVPTTILADQHFRTFSERYKNFPVMVEVISRFRSGTQQKKIIEDFTDGKIDMLIGTHRLLSKDIKPKDLGLIIVDEEQRFGVNTKEKIKLLKKEVDVLTLSATPIPRTLYMSLTGIRDIVLIETYPSGRFPIETFVGEKSDHVIKMAIEREKARGGQVYYVHNRIRDIQEKQYKLKALVPEARIALTHGRMEGREIEKIMKDFLDKKYDILLTTSIIESGMDISNVNTLIVEDSHRFGLAQLYQIRGRVGRSSEKAYAYLFYPSRKFLNLAAFQRLKTLAEYTELGSGYRIAMKDLELRGAGELLGAKQSGHINSVGFDMYCQIIKEEVDRLKGEAVPEDITVQIELPFSAYIPKNYVRNEKERINIYKALGNLRAQSEAIEIESKIQERYGKMPEVLLNLIKISRLKQIAKVAQIEQIVFSKYKGIIFRKLNYTPEKARLLGFRNPRLIYTHKNREVIVKNSDKDISLDLVLSCLKEISALG